ncbi:MAG TPA: pilin assembly protein [Moraxellaceae bacterium]
MKMQQLLGRWQSLSRPSLPRVTLQADLDHHDAARLQALAEMYPGCDTADIMADLLHYALNEVEQAFPYVHGNRQVGEDEFGDPLYEDIGPTPRFLDLTRKHLRELEHR